MLFLVWSLIDFMILCRGGEREIYRVGIFCFDASAYSGANRDRTGACAYFWMIPV